MSTDARTPGGGRSGLAARLLLAFTLVMGVAGVTAWLVAGLAGPVLFHRHLVGTGVADPAAVVHAEEAFRSASALSVGLALAVGLAMSLGVAVVLARRVGRSLNAVATAAALLAGGRFDARVPQPRLGAEFDALATSFNAMAGRLAESEQLRRRLLADVAHELRTPVATLGAYLDGLEDGVVDLEPQTIAVLRAQGTRLTRLADDLAAVTRAEAPGVQLARVRTDPNDLVGGAAAAVADRAAAAGVVVRVDPDAGLPQVLVDRDRLGQVLGNLLDNALRHTPAGGTITLATGRASDGAVRLTVADTGSGIPAEHLPHVFERFYRVDTARSRTDGGSGIGLAIVRALVEAHGGRVVASSDGPGRGARFEIELPPAP
ncbi:HAMP domain-containing sensor histidine kinase [Cellulomonas sp. 73-145]|uniref:sensor histidine kinase n=1 Tax=Cellulomonas sp. 73-145 TaxID=1895739 RepID=UPI000AF2759E|nr:HAMP domain-containing sensor histidine kinase [Cellulomonas sp. 73-145]